jgi:hypothetical protein
VDTQQLFEDWADALDRAQSFHGGMHWKTVAGKQYLFAHATGEVTARASAKNLRDRKDSGALQAEQGGGRRATAKRPEWPVFPALCCARKRALARWIGGRGAYNWH